MERIPQVIDLLYAAVAQPSEWLPALDGIVALAKADHAILLGQLGDHPAPFAVTARLSEEHRALFLSEQSHQLFNPFQAAVPAGVPVLGESLISEREFVRSVVYNEIIRPAKGYYAVYARNHRGDVGYAVSLCRGRHSGAFTAETVVVLKPLLPHVMTALALQHRIEVAEGSRATLAQLLDRLDGGVILTSGSGRPVFTNARALAIASEGDGLVLGAAGLTATTPAATRELRRAIAETASDRTTAGHSLYLPRPGRPPLILSLMPIWRLDAAIPGAAPPRVAIFLSEPDRKAVIDRAALAETFRLTRRESEVAALLAEGLSLDEIARRLDVELSAVRQYVKRTFSKTDTHSQAALVAVMRSYTVSPY